MPWTETPIGMGVKTAITIYSGSSFQLPETLTFPPVWKTGLRCFHVSDTTVIYSWTQCFIHDLRSSFDKKLILTIKFSYSLEYKNYLYYWIQNHRDIIRKTRIGAHNHIVVYSPFTNHIDLLYMDIGKVVLLQRMLSTIFINVLHESWGILKLVRFRLMHIGDKCYA